MRNFFFIIFISFTLACARRGNIVEVGGYAFEYENKTYRIQSVTPTLSEGYNFLTLRDGETLVFKAIDKEQDGILDEVQIGNLTLSQANMIYNVGITEGERRGYIKKRTFAREYQFSDVSRNYVLATYILANGEIYNKLTITDRSGFKSTIVVLDTDADGKLDEVSEGTETLGEYQKIYQNVLDKGVQANRIHKMNGHMVVVP